MKTWHAFFVSAFLLAGCSGERDPFQEKLKTIALGASQSQVEGVLGKPNRVYTPTNHPGSLWTAGTSQVWDYWADPEGRFELNGSVHFDEQGRVRFLYSHSLRIRPTQ